MVASILQVLAIVAALASIFGLVFSWKAWRSARRAEMVAQRAEDAARAAREEVRRGNAAEDLQTLTSMAKDFLSCVENGHIEAACLRARDLVSGVNEAKERWQGIFPPDIRQELNATSKQVSIVARNLSIRGGAITPEERDRLLRFCHGVVTTLATETGKIRLLNEQE
jgi:hypothetical protein